jgi:hypothetical protein
MTLTPMLHALPANMSLSDLVLRFFVFAYIPVHFYVMNHRPNELFEY